VSRYTVVWAEEALDDLAEIWMSALDRDGIALASRTVDEALSEDPATCGIELSEGLRSFSIPPLKALFSIEEDDRLVRVARILQPTSS
jgi:plasmid stabilization system protein ParE